MNTQQFITGGIVRARGREWVILPQSKAEALHLRPLGGGEDSTMVITPALEREPVTSASFPYPQVNHAGTQSAGLLLRDALMLKLRAGAGPFRSFGNIAVEPRAYQLVPLMMALKLDVIRLLIADDVGIGKTIEAGLIAREMLDRSEIDRLTVLCPPHLCEQWHSELKNRFHIDAVVVRSTTAKRLERGLQAGSSIFTEYPFTIISLDYIKNKNRRDAFAEQCPDFVIVDEAHTCSRNSQGRQQRYELLKDLASKPERHLVMLTATPHSGDDDAFYNLLALLKPEFADLKHIENANHPLRQQLAEHFIQRRRQDIKEWQDAALFPERLTAEATYKLSGEWESIFQDVLDYARELVEREQQGTLKARMNWWAALALLRCISSSPQAAIRALNTRLTNTQDAESSNQQQKQIALDAQGAMNVLDGMDDSLSVDDTEPGAALPEDTDRLKLLVERAQRLESQSDPKLKALLKALKPMLEEGYNPVIFCRYIATADYLAQQLGKKFAHREVIFVTGNLTSAERQEKIESLKNSDKDPILVATDCLSEGINLQDQFSAVIHYDLSWNPTRHEQREGRVDRFGQQAKTVKTLMFYGDDNPIDGAVLQVILRKAESIRKALGVSVPMPEDDNRITQAILNTVLLRKQQSPGKQLDLFAEDEQLQALDAKWQSARDKARQHRTVFAQNRLKPEDVLPEWQKAFAVLGSEDDVRRFVITACARLGAPLQALSSGGYRAPLQHLGDKHPQLSDRLAAADLLQLQNIDFQYPSAAHAEFIHRTHPLVSQLAEYLAEIAMSGANTDLVARAGVIFSAEIETKTTIYLLRLRSRLAIKRAEKTRDLLTEEALAVAVSAGGEAEVLPKLKAMQLMQAKVSKNISPERKQRELTSALDELPARQSLFEKIARERAETLLTDHRRTREAAEARGKYSIHPQLPVDVIGVYMLIPDVGLV